MNKANRFLYSSNQSILFRFKVCAFLLLLLPTFPNFIYSQAFQRLTEQNGLNTNLCRDIAQDNLGFIWIATENGLARFDGALCKIYHPIEGDTNSISCYAINSITIGQSGNLWVSGNDGYINQYDPRHDIFKRTYIQEIDDIPDRRIYNHYEDDSILWMAGEIGLLKHNLSTKKTEVFNPNTEIKDVNIPFLQTVHGFHQDKFDPNLLWISTRAGLLSLEKRSMVFKYHTKYIPEIKDVGQYSIKTIYQDEKGIIWTCGGWNGIKSYDPNSQSWNYYFSNYYPLTNVRNDITDFIPKSDTEFWICSYANGFGTFDVKTGTYEYITNHESMPYAVQKGPILKLISDYNNTIWMAGALGVSYFNPMPSNIKIFEFPPKRIQHSLTEIYTTSFEKISDQEVLVGTSSGDGLYLTNLQTGITKTINKYVGKNYEEILQKQTTTDFNDLQVIDLLKVSKDRIWVAIDTQFAYFDVLTNSLVFPESTNTTFFRNSIIRHLQLDSDGYMWGINYAKRALFKASATTGELLETYKFGDLLPDELGHEKLYGIWSFYIDQNDIFWMHTYSSVIIRDMNTDSVQILTKGKNHEKELTGINFFNITGGDKGEILLSSFENGLQIIHPNTEMDSFSIIGVDQGLPIQRVVKVQNYNGIYWLSTRKGLVAYDPLKNTIQTYDSKDGIPNDDLINYWTISLDISDNGEVFFGIPNKFCVITNDISKKVDNHHDLYFTQINVLGNEKKFPINTPYLDEINLKASENFFTIFFSTNNYSFNASPVFKYRLVGYNDNWITAGKERKASFTKVPGGTYTFEVKYSDDEGSIDESMIQLEINIATPFYKSNLFFVLIALLISLLIYMLYNFRMTQIKSREKLKTEFARQKAELEMNALRAQMNPHFIFNSLNSINKFILVHDPRTASQYLTKFSRLIRLILSNSKSREVSLEDELNALSLYIEMEQIRFENKFHFEQNIETTIDPSSILIPPLLLQPYIENAIWHGLMPLEKPGKLTLKIYQEKDTLVCVIDDSGIGRFKAMEIKERSNIRKKSMGMQITSDRLKLAENLHNIKTEINIEDKEDSNGNPKGTRVTLKIPIQKLSSDSKK